MTNESNSPQPSAKATPGLQFAMPTRRSHIIKVIGVGGGGGNAVNHMYLQGIKDVDFIICNTDAQALEQSPVPTKVQLGPTLTEGRGAGSKPETGREAARENLEDVKSFLSDNTKMVFITAGMGGGTGTGAAPVIAALAKEMGILTVGIVSVPFDFEGPLRRRQAEDGLAELRQHVDSLLIISNDRVRAIHGNLPLRKAFGHADDVLATAARSIADIITHSGYLNVDFEDVRTVMQNSGVSIMGSAIMEGEGRALKAIEMAIASPLLSDSDIRGAKKILLNITSGEDEITMDEIGEITAYIRQEAGNNTEMIWGNCYDDSLGNAISVTIIATGFETTNQNAGMHGILGGAAATNGLTGTIADRPLEKVVHMLNNEPQRAVELGHEHFEQTSTTQPDGMRILVREPLAPAQPAQQAPVQQTPVQQAPVPPVYTPSEFNAPVVIGSPFGSPSASTQTAAPEPTIAQQAPAEPHFIQRPVALEVTNLEPEPDQFSQETQEAQPTPTAQPLNQQPPVVAQPIERPVEKVVLGIDDEVDTNQIDQEDYKHLHEQLRQNASLPTTPFGQEPTSRPTTFEAHKEGIRQSSAARLKGLTNVEVAISSIPRISDPRQIEAFEREPAYLRKGVPLQNLPHSSEMDMSRYGIKENAEGRPEMRERNAFLHDKVD